MKDPVSKTPLFQKLGYKPGMKVWTNYPAEKYRHFFDSFPEEVFFCNASDTEELDMVHLFWESVPQLVSLPSFTGRLKPNGAVWISWPKKNTRMPGALNENRIREIALACGLVDVKVCAVDDTWSALKLVIPLAARRNA